MFTLIMGAPRPGADETRIPDLCPVLVRDWIRQFRAANPEGTISTYSAHALAYFRSDEVGVNFELVFRQKVDSDSFVETRALDVLNPCWLAGQNLAELYLHYEFDEWILSEAERRPV